MVNKPQIWKRTLASGEPTLDAEEQPIFDLLIWVGEEHYKYCPDYLEETRRYGASRRLNPNLDLSLLSRSSRMILAHPHVLNTHWQEQRPPQSCKKRVPGHDVPTASHDVKENARDETGEERTSSFALNGAATGKDLMSLALLPEAPQTGPCLFKLWELIPREAAQTVIEATNDETGTQHAGVEALPLCLREIGSTIYQYRPTGESADGLVPGLFAALPITGFALIRFQDGSVNEQAKAKIQAGLEVREQHALPFYETDR